MVKAFWKPLQRSPDVTVYTPGIQMSIPAFRLAAAEVCKSFSSFFRNSMKKIAQWQYDYNSSDSKHKLSW